MTKAQRMQMKAQKQQSTTHKAKMLDELLLDMKKVIKILWAHRLITKAQRMQMKAQKHCAQQQK